MVKVLEIDVVVGEGTIEAFMRVIGGGLESFLLLIGGVFLGDVRVVYRLTILGEGNVILGRLTVFHVKEVKAIFYIKTLAKIDVVVGEQDNQNVMVRVKTRERIKNEVVLICKIRRN